MWINGTRNGDEEGQIARVETTELGSGWLSGRRRRRQVCMRLRDVSYTTVMPRFLEWSEPGPRKL